MGEHFADVLPCALDADLLARDVVWTLEGVARRMEWWWNFGCLEATRGIREEMRSNILSSLYLIVKLRR